MASYLSKLRQLEQAATPGPLVVAVNEIANAESAKFYKRIGKKFTGTNIAIYRQEDKGLSWVADCGVEGGNSLLSAKANAEFFAASRTAIPRLLKVAEAAEEADKIISQIHDELYALGLAEEAIKKANDLIWNVHDTIRQALKELEVEG